MNHKKLSPPFAATAAALFLAGCGGSTHPAQAPAATGDEATVKCLGIHACKGQSQCGVEGGHACTGQNECKGKGWIQVPQSECDAKGGTVQT